MPPGTDKTRIMVKKKTRPAIHQPTHSNALVIWPKLVRHSTDNPCTGATSFLKTALKVFGDDPPPGRILAGPALEPQTALPLVSAPALSLPQDDHSIVVYIFCRQTVGNFFGQGS